MNGPDAAEPREDRVEPATPRWSGYKRRAAQPLRLIILHVISARTLGPFLEPRH